MTPRTGLLGNTVAAHGSHFPKVLLVKVPQVPGHRFRICTASWRVRGGSCHLTQLLHLPAPSPQPPPPARPPHSLPHPGCVLYPPHHRLGQNGESLIQPAGGRISKLLSIMRNSNFCLTSSHFASCIHPQQLLAPDLVSVTTYWVKLLPALDMGPAPAAPLLIQLPVNAPGKNSSRQPQIIGST